MPTADTPTVDAGTLSPEARRPVGVALELVALLPVLVVLAGRITDDHLSPVFLLGLTTGMGWVLIGRRRFGVLLAVARMLILLAGMYVLLYALVLTSCAPGDAACFEEPWRGQVSRAVTWALALLYSTATIASALGVARSHVVPPAEAAGEA
jgi:hypothetical protein